MSDTNPQIDNGLFRDVVIGVLLLISAVVFSFAKYNYLKALQVPYLLAVGALGSAALLLLFKTFRKDKYRLNNF